MSSVDFLVKLRDAAHLIADACEEQLEKMAPGKIETSWDPENIEWQQAEGTRGPYERSEDVNNADFKVMLKEIQKHQGKLSRNGYFYWTFQNGVTVGRKKQKQA